MNQENNTKLTTEQIKVIKFYSRIVKKLGFHPTRNVLKENGLTKDKVEYHFGSLTNLRQKAKDSSPEAFKNIIDEEMFNPKKFAELLAHIKPFKKFVITTGVTGCEVHKGFLEAIRYYCAVNNACLLILPCSEPTKIGENKWFMVPELQKENIVFGDVALNSNLFISSIKLQAKMIDPITSLTRIGSRHGSFIYASPKQRLKYVPVSNVKYPHAVMTTGAITKPHYTPERYMSERTAYIADHDHVIGAIVVEIVDDNFFHFRQIQAESSGAFVDLGVYYKDNSVGDLPPKALVLGDLHHGEEDEKTIDAWMELISEVKPKILVLHDVFDGASINHHETNRTLTKALRSINNQASLEKELTNLAKELNLWASMVEEVIVVKSNHDMFLQTYLEEGKYLYDGQNHLTALKLAVKVLEGKDPLKEGVEMYGLTAKNIRWLSRDEDYKIARIQLGAHGDVGANGSKGSIKGMEAAYGNCVTAHTHTPEILRGAWVVGTSTKLKLSYNRGPSSWVHSSCLVYPNGSRQLINAFDGAWKLEE